MISKLFLDGKVTLYAGDCIDVLAGLPENSVDSIVTDPPYHLTSITKRVGKEGSAPIKYGTDGAFQRATSGFMGKVWDGGDIAFQPATWAAVLRVLKPGGHMVAFSGTRTYHRMVCAIEDAGFEIRDQLAWMYGSGFPKSHDVSKGIDKAAGVKFDAKPASGVGFMGPDGPGGYNVTKNQLTRSGESTDAARQWQGWGSSLKPAFEPICLARKPLSEKVIAANVLQHGTGAINIDGCRVGTDGGTAGCDAGPSNGILGNGLNGSFGKPVPGLGRFPANLIHDGSDEVLAGFPETTTGKPTAGKLESNTFEGGWSNRSLVGGGDTGSAARFFYTAKADSEDRLGSKHPTVKPLDLMQYLCRLITPPGGTVLDMFAGTGTTGEAAWREGFKAILIEREAEYQADIARRMELAVQPTKRAAVAKTKNKLMGAEGTPLFSQEAAE